MIIEIDLTIAVLVLASLLAFAGALGYRIGRPAPAPILPPAGVEVLPVHDAARLAELARGILTAVRMNQGIDIVTDHVYASLRSAMSYGRMTGHRHDR